MRFQVSSLLVHGEHICVEWAWVNVRGITEADGTYYLPIDAPEVREALVAFQQACITRTERCLASVLGTPLTEEAYGAERELAAEHRRLSHAAQAMGAGAQEAVAALQRLHEGPDR